MRLLVFTFLVLFALPGISAEDNFSCVGNFEAVGPFVHKSGELNTEISVGGSFNDLGVGSRLFFNDTNVDLTEVLELKITQLERISDDRIFFHAERVDYRELKYYGIFVFQYSKISRIDNFMSISSNYSLLPNTLICEG